MKRNNLPSIDISQSVMQRIERDGVKMRSSKHFILMTVAKYVLLALSIFASLLGFMSLLYVAKNDTFTDLKTLLNQTEFLKSLPWFGIILTSISSIVVISIIILIQKSKPKFKLSYAFAVWIILIAGVLGIAGKLSPEHTPSVIARVAYFSDKDPSKVYGEVLEVIDSTTIKIKVNDEILTVIYKDSDVKVGDKVFIIGNVKNGQLYAKYVSVKEYAPEKEEIVVEKPKPERKEEVKQPEPEPEIKPESAPAPEPKSETPAPTPEPTNTIYVSSVKKLSSTKYEVKWTSNFQLENGFKLVWGTSPNPIYPASPDPGYPYYYFDGTSAKSGTGYIKDSFGPGTYYARVCQYLGGSCGIYSESFTVSFP